MASLHTLHEALGIFARYAPQNAYHDVYELDGLLVVDLPKLPSDGDAERLKRLGWESKDGVEWRTEL